MAKTKKSKGSDSYSKRIKINAVTIKPSGKVDRALALRLFHQMLLTQLVEERLLNLYKQSEISGGLFTGTGNEAVSVGAASTLKKGDIMAPSHRSMGAHFVRGESIQAMLLQLMGRAEGQTRGRDNAAHQGSIERGIVSYISHLGTSAMVGLGCALANKIKKNKSVVLAFIGEGTTSLGDFHEMLNFASVLNLPFVLVIENNQWAYSTPSFMQYKCEKLSDRAVGYGIAGTTIDGTDVELVYRTVQAAVERARKGLGPSLIETVTYRISGHSAHDAAEYAPPELLQKAIKSHPVTKYRKVLIRRGWLTKKQSNQFIKEISSELDSAHQYAKSAPLPEPDTAIEGVYAA